MAIDPQNINLVDFKGLSVAFNPTLGWVMAIQDPNSDVITQISLETIGQLIAGEIQLPNGVINGLDVTFNNGTTPKTGSVSAGQWRINNGVYQINVPYVSNINDPSSSDRTDAFIADDTGSVFYQPNWSGNLVPGQILVRQFTVYADDSDIDSGQTPVVQYAVMNSNNNGYLQITSPEWVDQVTVFLNNINGFFRNYIKNSNSGALSSAGFLAINDLDDILQLMITSSNYSGGGLTPRTLILRTEAPGGVNIVSPSLLHNGEPIGGGSSALTFTEEVDSDGNVDLSGKTGMPVAGTIPSALRVFSDDVDYSQSASYTPSSQIVFVGLEENTEVTIKITF